MLFARPRSKLARERPCVYRPRAIFCGKLREKSDNDKKKKNTKRKRKRKENRSYRLRSARLSVVDYEVAISQCARAWLISSICLLKFAKFRLAHGWREKDRKMGREGEGREESDYWELRSGSWLSRGYAEPWTNCLYIFQMSQSCVPIRSLFTSSSFTNDVLRHSPASACPPRMLRQRFRIYVNGF